LLAVIVVRGRRRPLAGLWRSAVASLLSTLIGLAAVAPRRSAACCSRSASNFATVDPVGLVPLVLGALAIPVAVFSIDYPSTARSAAARCPSASASACLLAPSSWCSRPTMASASQRVEDDAAGGSSPPSMIREHGAPPVLSRHRTSPWAV
jgi:hypothetical protein